MSTITFEEGPVDLPKMSRKPKPNPYTDPVNKLVVDSGKGFRFTAPADIKLTTIRSQLDRAARERKGGPVSLRWNVTDNPDGSHTVVVAAISKIKREA